MTTEGNPLQNARVAYEYYELPGELVDIQPLGNGLINKTYQITHTHEDEEKQYVLQAIGGTTIKRPTKAAGIIKNHFHFIGNSLICLKINICASIFK